MKRVLLFILFIFSCSGAYAQSVDFSMGQVVGEPVMISQIKVGMPIDIKSVVITPFGGWKTYSQGGVTYYDQHPFIDRYDIGIEIEWKGFYCTAAHYCMHNVLSFYTSNNYTDQITPRHDSRWTPAGTWGTQLTTVTIGYKKTFNHLVLWE